MKKTKRVTKIVESLNALNKTDVYSLLLFTLYKMHDDPKYATLSELSYILKGENLSNFLNYYGGMTITIPTLKELRLVLNALVIYQYVNLEKGTFEDALSIISQEFDEQEIKETYQKILDVIANYEFSRD